MKLMLISEPVWDCLFIQERGEAAHGFCERFQLVKYYYLDNNWFKDTNVMVILVNFVISM